VQVRSVGVNKGSEFTVILPTLPNVPERESIAVLQRSRPTGNPVRVLVVEDNIDAGDSLSLLLRLHGHGVLVARSGPSALEVASTYQPHLVLLDIGLPGMDGYEVARHLRQKPEFKNVLLCALTGHTPSDAGRDRPQYSVFDHHFIKPVDLNKLLAVLDAAASTDNKRIDLDLDRFAIGR